MRLQKARQTEKAGRERQRMEKELVALLCFPRSVSRIDRPWKNGIFIKWQDILCHSQKCLVKSY